MVLLKNVDASNTAKINPVAAGASKVRLVRILGGYALAKKVKRHRLIIQFRRLVKKF